jgi:hypothetical protein
MPPAHPRKTASTTARIIGLPHFIQQRLRRCRQVSTSLWLLPRYGSLPRVAPTHSFWSDSLAHSSVRFRGDETPVSARPQEKSIPFLEDLLYFTRIHEGTSVQQPFETSLREQSDFVDRPRKFSDALPPRQLVPNRRVTHRPRQSLWVRFPRSRVFGNFDSCRLAILNKVLLR